MTLKSYSLLGLGATLAIAGSGCGMMIAQMIDREPTTVESHNPLASGSGTLRADAKPAHNEVRSHAAPEFCDQWPVADEYVLSITEDRICATVQRATDKAYGEITEPSSWRRLSIRGSQSAEIALTSVQDRRLATCDPGGSRLEVWTRRYEGCTGNDGVVTADTTTVIVDGDITWNLSP